MSRVDLSTQELFLRLGSTPTLRSARADRLFRQLRQADAEIIRKALLSSPSRLALGAKSEAAE